MQCCNTLRALAFSNKPMTALQHLGDAQPHTGGERRGGGRGFGGERREGGGSLSSA
ncbi:hypothetical protein ACLB1O_27885 [Escherichia coli]